MQEPWKIILQEMNQVSWEYIFNNILDRSQFATINYKLDKSHIAINLHQSTVPRKQDLFTV